MAQLKKEKRREGGRYQKKVKGGNAFGHKVPYKYPEVETIMDLRLKGRDREADDLGERRQRVIFGLPLHQLNGEEVGYGRR